MDQSNNDSHDSAEDGAKAAGQESHAHEAKAPGKIGLFFGKVKNFFKSKKGKYLLLGLAATLLVSAGMFTGWVIMQKKVALESKLAAEKRAEAEAALAAEDAEEVESSDESDSEVAESDASSDAEDESESTAEAAENDQHSSGALHGEENPKKMGKIQQKALDGWQEMQKKLHEIRNALGENEALRLENANLRLQLESFQFDCSKRAASTHTQELEFKVNKETGSVVGRTLASIHYRPPNHLLPSQLYTLGVSYFKTREDEKAAVILTFITGIESHPEFATPQNYLMTAIAWYRLDNFEAADEYFGKVLAMKESQETLPFQAQSRLWRALVAQRTSKYDNSQEWLLQLIDHHPHSPEAGWINKNRDGTRVRSAASITNLKEPVKPTEVSKAPKKQHGGAHE